MDRANKKTIKVTWINWDSVKKGKPAQVMPTEHAQVDPKNRKFLAKMKTSDVLSFSKEHNIIETQNTVYILEELPYFKALMTNKLPTLTKIIGKVET